MKKPRVSKRKFDLLDEGDPTTGVQMTTLRTFSRSERQTALLRILGLHVYTYDEKRDKDKPEYAHGKGKKDWKSEDFVSPFAKGILKDGRLDRLPAYFRLAFWITVQPNAPVGYFIRQMNGFGLKTSYRFVKRNLPKLRQRYFGLVESPKDMRSKHIDPSSRNFLRLAAILLSSAACETGVGQNMDVRPNFKLLGKFLKKIKVERLKNRVGHGF